MEGRETRTDYGVLLPALPQVLCDLGPSRHMMTWSLRSPLDVTTPARFHSIME